MARLDEVELRDEAAAAGTPIPRPTTSPRIDFSPPQDASGNPVWTSPPQDRAQPVWAVEDRIQYWRAVDDVRQQQLEQQQRRMQALQEAQRQQQQLLDDFYERRMIQHPRQAVQWAENENRRGEEQRRQWQMIVDSTGFSDVNAARRAYDFPKSIEERQRAARFLDLTQQSPNAARNPLGGAIDLARTEIPYAQQVASSVRTGIEATAPVARAVPVVGPLQMAGEKLPYVPTPSGVVGAAAEAMIPTEVWQAVLELLPGVGSVPDAIRLIKNGAPDALRALDNVLGSEAAQSLRMRLASEYGGGPVDPTTNLPDVVKALVQKKPRGTQKLDEAVLARKWTLLPKENQKFLTTVANITLSKEETAALKAASKGRKAGQIRTILEEGTGSAERVLADAAMARKGVDLPRTKPIRAEFTDDEIDSYFRQVKESVAKGLLTPNEAVNAGDALRLVFDGRRLLKGTETANTAPLMPHERKYLAKVLGPDFGDLFPNKPEQLTLFQKVFAPLHLWRSFKTAFDISAPGRQGKKLMFSNFPDWWKAWGQQFKAMKSEEGFEAAYTQVTNSRFYDVGQSTTRPLAILRPGEGKMDEFLSPLSSRLWGLGHSERGYLGFLNHLRQSAFDRDMSRMVKVFGSIDDVPQQVVQDLIDNINNATLYGNLDKAGNLQPAVQTVFFSARGLASLPQYVTDVVKAGTPWVDMHPEVRKIIAGRAAAWMGTNLTALTALAAVGYGLNKDGVPSPVKVDLNPKSDTFGEVRFAKGGEYNPWGAYQSLARYAAQIATGERLRKGDVVPQSVARPNMAEKFTRNKLSPAAALVYDFVFSGGRDFRGRELSTSEPENLARYALESAAPIIAADIVNSFVEQGWMGVGGALARGVGEDVQSYQPNEKVEEKAEEDKAALQWQDWGASAREKKPWPEQLDKDWPGGAWNQLFKSEFPELGRDLSDFKDKAEAKKAYIDYWWDQKGLNGAPSEDERRAAIGRAFDNSDFANKWDANVQAERLNWLDSLTPAQLAEVRKTYILTVSEKEALGVD